MANAITQETVNSMILDAGVVYLNYGLIGEKILGATEGGNTFKVEREIKTISVDGARGKVRGLRRLISENASITTNLKELNARTVQIALAGSKVTEVKDVTLLTKIGEKVTPGSSGSTFDYESDYLKNIAIVASVSGSKKPVIITIHNVLSDGEFSIGLVDTEEAVVAVTFSAHYDPFDMDVPIYDIVFPTVAP